MDSIVKIDGVSKYYNKQKVIDNVCAEFEKGKIHGIIGRNGSGKTVLLKLMCGLTYANQGEVVVNEQIIGKDVETPYDIGIIIEAPGFLCYQSAMKNLEHLASYRRKITKKEISQIIQKVGLDPNSKKHVGKYSLGMRQRLGLAQAIMENPSLLILDEPFNGLDEDGIDNMRKLLLNYNRMGTTIVIATHMKDDINMLCDTVCNMVNGKLERIR